MEFELNDEQRQFKASLDRFLETGRAFGADKLDLRQGDGWRPQVWQDLASQLGVLAVGLPDRLGGFGGGVEQMVVMESVGRALAPEPVAETLLQAAPLLAQSESPAADALLQGIAAGSVRIALAIGEDGVRDDFRAIACSARDTDAGWQIDGAKQIVVGAPWATHLLVAARHAGQAGDATGLSLFVVAADVQGLELRPYRMLDERWAADVSLDGVEVPREALIGVEGDGLALLEEWRDRAIAAASAEACGILERLVEETVAYARQREQFGQTIGSFQALQHRMVDMHLQLELARSAALLACQTLDEPADVRGRAASAARLTVAQACRFVGQNAVQIHGGMGMTDELAIGHFFKRATVIEHSFGSEGFHLRRRAAG
ncbi:alkylation response protein AidB-like acyl-CoA dehydrogenase [Novosphingobium kunmingense]|uniref:Alkylation response protein AidB-like acyl-CoA dehydrogenase n=1 Tax=Novosphingobium kunmingense TaxID=1211806 RepID=A0A2N0H779_9SPHN|nr:acyl-CoA dehydrogenase family protein [Novosphingobium kunmingense]PKB14793.1 alkylation response protein AidB-like acyl-CoA dehydrogenase [Novosphingobium kunmingense]